MKFSQTTFNMIITVVLLVYCMLMFALSWSFSRPLDLNNFLILVAPLLSQIIHNVSLPTNAKVESGIK